MHFVFIQWPQWGRPDGWYWLLALVPVVLMLWWYGRWRSVQARRLADARLLPAMLLQPALPWWWRSKLALVLALALLGVALLKPQVPREDAGLPLQGYDVVLAIDVSKSMLATDIAPSRLQQAKALATRLLDTLQGSRIAVVAFAGNAWQQLPLTTDLQAARTLVSELDINSVPLEGTDLEQALVVAADALPKTAPAHKAVVLLTDGEELEGNAIAATRRLKSEGIKLLIMGVATAAGAPLTDEAGYPIRQPDASQVISRLNEPLLQQLAAQSNGHYLRWQGVASSMASLLNELQQLPRRPMPNSFLINFFSYGHYLIALALLLLVLGNSSLGRLPASPPGLGLLALLPLAAAAQPQPSQGLLRQADDAFKAGNWNQAATLYADAAKAGAGWQALLQQGNVAYRQGRFADAIGHYNQAMEAATQPAAKAQILHNRGLALVRLGQLPAAAQAFRAALQWQPDDADAIRNLNIVLESLRQQPPPPQPPPSKKAADKLDELQQEEKKIRQQLQKQKRPQSQGGKNW
jgi:Ca-activated chloride channel family protein